MKKGLTELVFILDKSGSMSGLEKDTIGGFNAMIKKQKKIEGEAFVSTVLFSDESHVLHDRVRLENVEELTEKDYEVSGCTALLDAIGNAVKHIQSIHKYARPEDVPEHTMFLITTDGMENASRQYNSEQVKKLIRQQEEKDGWEFLFVAANIDAVSTAQSIGIRPDRAANYMPSPVGTQKLYDAISCAVSSARASAPLSADWAKKLEEDEDKQSE